MPSPSPMFGRRALRMFAFVDCCNGGGGGAVNSERCARTRTHYTFQVSAANWIAFAPERGTSRAKNHFIVFTANERGYQADERVMRKKLQLCEYVCVALVPFICWRRQRCSAPFDRVPFTATVSFHFQQLLSAGVLISGGLLSHSLALCVPIEK